MQISMMIIVASMNPAVLVHAPCCSPCATATFPCCMYVSHKQLLLAAASAAAAAHQLPCSSFEVLSCLGVPVWWVPWRFLTRRETRTRIFQNPNSASVRRHKYPPQHRRCTSSSSTSSSSWLARSLSRSPHLCLFSSASSTSSLSSSFWFFATPTPFCAFFCLLGPGVWSPCCRGKLLAFFLLDPLPLLLFLSSSSFCASVSGFELWVVVM